MTFEEFYKNVKTHFPAIFERAQNGYHWPLDGHDLFYLVMGLSGYRWAKSSYRGTVYVSSVNMTLSENDVGALYAWLFIHKDRYAYWLL
jgi:hypothetical protein